LFIQLLPDKLKIFNYYVMVRTFDKKTSRFSEIIKNFSFTLITILAKPRRFHRFA